MFKRLSELEKYNYYFQFTLNAYNKDVEPNIPSKNDIIIPAFQRLSREIGKERVVWRYDPIFFNEHYTMEYHCKYFNLLASRLEDYTEFLGFVPEYSPKYSTIKPSKGNHTTAN